VSTTTRPSYTQPVFLGGAVMGALSALPIISAGNLCCCLWVVSGGVVASYLLQQNQSDPVTPGDGLLVGLLAGVVGAFIYLVLSIPITILVAPLERELIQRVLDNAGSGVRPEMRAFVGNVGGVLQLVFGFIFMLVAGSIFSSLGGLLGAVLFKKPTPLPASE